MSDVNGKQTATDLAHRIGIWGVVVAMAVKLFTIGSWVGAADEKFSDAESVERKQDELILDVNTLTTEQKHTTQAVEDLKTQSEKDKKEILAAIAAIQKE